VNGPCNGLGLVELSLWEITILALITLFLVDQLEQQQLLFIMEEITATLEQTFANSSILIDYINV